MPRIVRAEFLSYFNARRNSDKLFNIFLIEDDDSTHRCVSEYGRRGNNLVRDTLCTGATRELAESKLRQRLAAKQNHRETPYTEDSFGYNYSPLAREYGYLNNRMRNNEPNSNRSEQSVAHNSIEPKKPNVIPFSLERKEIERDKPQRAGILNKEQFDSLEI